NSALTNLVFAGQANLDAAKVLAATKASTNYTSASWSILINALGLPETINSEVVAKTTAINNALSGLKIKQIIAVGQSIYLKAGTKYWSNAIAAKNGIGGYTLKTSFTTTITRVYSNGCFNVKGDLGWFNPNLLV
ncbi:MAG: hypothetical protein WC343_01440, partial [Bacilli bacterium]